MNEIKPWVSFCLSTYKRPELLKIQLTKLLNQSFLCFEIVIADNDPESSGKAIANSFNDSRIKYECNEINIGMVKSYNRAIDRAQGIFLVMITDDDPVDDDMLDFFYTLHLECPGYSLYSGVNRVNKEFMQIESINAHDFIFELLDTSKTKSIHWSSSIIEKTALLKIGKLDDYQSGHLVDHAMLTKVGSINGAIFVNKEFSQIKLHQSNYSKSNFEDYFYSCSGFYITLMKYFQNSNNIVLIEQVILMHVHQWFTSWFFVLRKLIMKQTNSNTKNLLTELDFVANKIMALKFMASCKFKYNLMRGILMCLFHINLFKLLVKYKLIK
jgi:glycosyltransferase involved in cell wall biosynthesis